MNLNILALNEAALSLAAAGIAVFPTSGKTPLTPHGYKDATTDPGALQSWFDKGTTLNAMPTGIGIPTGKVNGLFVVDIDPKNGGAEGLKALLAEAGPLPETVSVQTGGGGEHLYYGHPGPPVANSVGKLAPGVDIRGDGGYVIVPPSLHASGKRYKFSTSVMPQDLQNLPPAPAWLLERIATDKRPDTPRKTLPTFWRGLFTDGVPEGQRNDSLTRLAGYLLVRSLDPYVVLEILHLWNKTHCHPPLTSEEVQKAFESICNKELKRRRA